jgi:hypothetical protein
MWWIHWPGALLELRVSVLNFNRIGIPILHVYYKVGTAQGLEPDLSGHAMAAFA